MTTAAPTAVPAKGVVLAAAGFAEPIVAFLYGAEGAARVRSICREGLHGSGGTDAVLELLEEVHSTLPALDDYDADGLVSEILPDWPYSHARWNAFFYGHCASAGHAPVEAVLLRELDETLASAFAAWCPPDVGAVLHDAIDQAERVVADGPTDELDRWILDDVLKPDPTHDATHPIYLPILDQFRVRHIHATFDRLSPEGLAEVKAHLNAAIWGRAR